MRTNHFLSQFFSSLRVFGMDFKQKKAKSYIKGAFIFFKY
ncbi:hypothetical protein STBHUCCB_39800 [Salmonella enterica subsp. enterica serovar Typhi str. P-stx-12]|nr:hypothetical protein STBHUCCB_39800 [Salmonella enterica subsp. enterica serovar Typhi str. P-stx-12]AXR56084.1 hypothetical protein CJP42_4957 [Salmonella enterica subsp. enterica serovar Typhi]